MKRLSFGLMIVAVLAVGAVILLRQQEKAHYLEVQLSTSSGKSVLTIAKAARTEPNTNSPDLLSKQELLRLRGEVSLLRRELDSLSRQKLSRQQAESDWALVHSGPKPSDHQDFIYFTNAISMGFGSAQAALQTYYHAMRNQDREPINPERMKLLWDVPDDFDVAGASYSIDIGFGLGDELGYRIVDFKCTKTNEVRLALEIERNDGSSFTRETVFVRKDDHWRMKPVHISKATDRAP